MSVGKFIWRLLWKTVTIGLIVVVMSFMSSPMVTNQIAMTQMENSNELYILFSNFANLKTMFDVIGVGAVLGLGISIESDIRKVTKSVNSENDTENEKEN